MASHYIFWHASQDECLLIVGRVTEIRVVDIHHVIHWRLPCSWHQVSSAKELKRDEIEWAIAARRDVAFHLRHLPVLFRPTRLVNAHFILPKIGRAHV